VTDSLRLAAFDFDGTLIDSAETIVQGILACWEACGFPEPEAGAVRRIIGLPWEAGVARLLPGSGAAEVAQIRAYHRDIAEGRRAAPKRATEQLFAGAAEALRDLEREGYLLAIVTSRSAGRLHEMLAAHGIDGHFVSVKTVDHGPGKPSPFLLQAAMEEAGVVAQATVMIGDTTFDMEMARNAGAAGIGVSWGVHDRGELAAAGAGHVVDRFDELAPLVARLTDGRP
jgi:phosphoglycolate phosphatase